MYPGTNQIILRVLHATDKAIWSGKVNSSDSTPLDTGTKGESSDSYPPTLITKIFSLHLSHLINTD